MMGTPGPDDFEKRPGFSEEERAVTNRLPPANRPPGFTVSQVLGGIADLLRNGLPGLIWVRGEVVGLVHAASRHVYFDLVEHRPDGSRFALPCAIWDSNRMVLEEKLSAAGLALAVGQEMLFAGMVRLYAEKGRLTFHVSDVIPEYTLGQVEARRRAVLARLQREQLVGRNARLPLPAMPLCLALLTSRRGAGLADFLKVLQDSGYAFRIDLWDIPVQGPHMEAIVCRTLNSLAQQQAQRGYDAACIIRGGGSTTDLSWWDSYPLCAAVARMPLPLLTGIGHETDRPAVEEVAWKALSTPTAAAQFFCQAVAAAESACAGVARELGRLVPQRLGRAIECLARCRQAVCEGAGQTRSHTAHRLEMSRSQLAAHASRCLEGSRTRPRVLAGWLAKGPLVRLQREGRLPLDRLHQAMAEGRQRLRGWTAEVRRVADQVGMPARKDLADEARRGRGTARDLRDRVEEVLAGQQQRIDSLRALVEAHDLGPLLRRGFSLTCDAEGWVIHSAAAVVPGMMLVTRLADGEIRSVVTGNHS